MYKGLWYDDPPHHCSDAAVSILVHDTGSDEYHVVYVLWQDNPPKFHIEGTPDILERWPKDWKWTHIDGD